MVTFWGFTRRAAISEVTTLTIVVMSSLKRSEKRVLRKLSRLSRLWTYCAMLFTYGGMGQCQQGLVTRLYNVRKGNDLKEIFHCGLSVLYWCWWWLRWLWTTTKCFRHTEWLPWWLEVGSVSSCWPQVRGLLSCCWQNLELNWLAWCQKTPAPFNSPPLSWRQREAGSSEAHRLLQYMIQDTQELLYNAVWAYSLLSLKLQ